MPQWPASNMLKKNQSTVDGFCRAYMIYETFYFKNYFRSKIFYDRPAGHGTLTRIRTLIRRF